MSAMTPQEIVHELDNGRASRSMRRQPALAGRADRSSPAVAAQTHAPKGA